MEREHGCIHTNICEYRANLLYDSQNSNGGPVIT